MIRVVRIPAIIFIIALATVPFSRAIAQGTRAAAGPTISKAAVGVRIERAATAKAVPLPKRHDERKNVAMMIVGGAALLVGAIIGDTPGQIIMVGGAGVGLYGLYKYLE